MNESSHSLIGMSIASMLIDYCEICKAVATRSADVAPQRLKDSLLKPTDGPYIQFGHEDQGHPKDGC